VEFARKELARTLIGPQRDGVDDRSSLRHAWYLLEVHGTHPARITLTGVVELLDR
jgi:hypothetical protein